MSQGVDPEPPRLHDGARRVEGATQAIPGGPVASQEAIKELGTNGGGFFNANSAHPFENPNGVHRTSSRSSRILAHPVRAHLHLRPDGRRTSARAGRSSRPCSCSGSASSALAIGVRGRRQPEARRRSASTSRHRDASRAGTWRARRSASAPRPRRSAPPSTTGTSNGSVNSMHDSFTPLGGAVPLVNMMLGEVEPRRRRRRALRDAVFAILAVFIAGLMVGRTPEYLGKKIQARRDEARRRSTSSSMPVVVLGFAGDRRCVLDAADVVDPQPRPARAHRDPLRVHVGGATTTARAFAGLTGEHRLVQHDARPRDAGRPLLPDHPDARRSPGRSRASSACPPSAGTFPTDTPLFVGAARRRDRHRRRRSPSSPPSRSARSSSTSSS